MGYYVSMNVDLRIPKLDQAECLQAINALHKPYNKDRLAHGGRMSNGVMQERWYSWVNNPPEGGFTDLLKAFEAWRYETRVEDNGDIYVYQFTGDKWGDDEILYEAIAPYVASVGSIDIRGDDDDEFHYEFKAGLLFEVSYEKIRVGEKIVEPRI